MKVLRYLIPEDFSQNMLQFIWTIGEDWGCNPAVLRVIDAAKLSNVYRIGIDFHTLVYFGLDPTMVEEEYKPQPNHLKPLQR